MARRRDIFHLGMGATLPSFFRGLEGGLVGTMDDSVGRAALAANDLRTDLAASTGASRIGLAGGGTLQSAIEVADTPAALLVSSVSLAIGSTIRTADGFAYLVAGPNSTDHDLITAGGFKLYYRPGPGVVNALAFGALGDDATDNTLALQSALDFAAKHAQAIRSVYLPAGIYRTGTIYLPLGVRLFGDGGAAETTVNSTTRLLQHGPGDVIRFKAHHRGAYRYWWGEVDHLTIWGDRAQRSGWGVNFRDHLGNAILPMDSSFLHHLTIRRCPEGGIGVPSGAFPMCIANCKLLFNNGPGIKLTRESTFQSIHFLNISGDGNRGGLISLNHLNDSSGSVLITNLKSEARVNFDYGSIELQHHAIELADCGGCPISIQGATHTSSISKGGRLKKPGDLIWISRGGAPEIRWVGVAVRVRETDTGENPGIIGAAEMSPPVRTSHRQTSGWFGGSHSLVHANLALSWSNAPDGDRAPSASGQNALVLNNSAATSIETFTNGNEGQVLHVLANNGNSTLVNGADIRLAGRRDFAMAENDSCTLIRIAGVWRELCRAETPNLH